MTGGVGDDNKNSDSGRGEGGGSRGGSIIGATGALGGAMSFKSFSKGLGTSSGTFSRKMFQEKQCFHDRFLVKDWLETLLGQSFAPDGEDQPVTSPGSVRDLAAAAGHKTTHLRTLEGELKRGVILCQVMNLLKPGTILKYNKAPDGFPFKQMENLHVFLEACRKELNLSNQDLFAEQDLHKGRFGNVYRVLVRLKNHFSADSKSASNSSSSHELPHSHHHSHHEHQTPTILSPVPPSPTVSIPSAESASRSHISIVEAKHSGVSLSPPSTLHGSGSQEHQKTVAQKVFSKLERKAKCGSLKVPPSSDAQHPVPLKNLKKGLFGGSFPNLLRTLSELPPAWNTQLPSVDARLSTGISQSKQEEPEEKHSPSKTPLLGAPSQAHPMTSLTNLLKQAKQRSVKKILSNDDDEWDTDPDYVSDDSPRGKLILKASSIQPQSFKKSIKPKETGSQLLSQSDPDEKFSVVFNKKRGKCEKGNCKCDQYVSKAKTENASDDGGPCLNCGHYPVKHQDLGNAEESLTQTPLNSWKIPYEELEFIFQIGSGAYGEVWKGMLWGSEVAIKVAKADKLDPHMLSEFQHEVEVLCALRHPNILLFIGAAVQPPQLCIVTELLEKGSLYDVLKEPSNLLDFKRRIGFAIDSCLGMLYLHQLHIMHCDLKCKNLLVAANWRVCVADFGLARVKKRTGSYIGPPNPESAGVGPEPLGTIGYMAPEIALETSGFTPAADVYSFAICLWEIFTGMEAYSGDDYYSIIRQLQNGERLPVPEEVWPDILSKLVVKCWAEDPEERPSFEKIIVQLRKLSKVEFADDPWLS